MQNRSSQSINTNYRVYVRVRPIDYQQKMTELTTDSISIKDPTNKSAEKQTFSFNQVFDQSVNQEQMFKQVAEPALNKLIEGQNSCVLAYGQTGSGKSYALFGEDEKYSLSPNNPQDKNKDRRGIIPRSIEYLLKKAKEYEEMREFIITVSFFELYLDQVRDLGRVQGNAQTNQTYESENLTIYENTNGQIMVKDLSIVQLSSMSDLYEFLKPAFKLREKFELKGSQIQARAHTIFTINLEQKDKENDDQIFLNSTIQIVDLAGSERIAKSLTEGHKFQEAILISSSLTALGKCLSSISQTTAKNPPYRESKLTRIIQNSLTCNSNVCLIVSLNPSESNFEECLSTLQFAERSKTAPLKSGHSSVQNSGEQEAMNIPQAGQEKQIKKLTDEINELKSRIEFKEKEYKNRINEIQVLLGIELDLDKLFQKAGAKELQQFKVQKEAVAKLETVQKINVELENKNQKLAKQIDEMKKEDAIKQERNSCTLLELKEQIRRLRDALTVSKMNSEDTVRQLNQEREAEIKRMIEKSNALLEEKVNIIVNLPQNIQTKTNENQKLQEIKRITRMEVEKEFKIQIDQLKNEQIKLLNAAKEQYEFFLKSKNDEIENFLHQFKKYREKKKLTMQEVKIEMCEMYDIIQKLQRVIERVESGVYSAGIKSFNIPARDKPIMPSRQKLKNCYKFLDQRSVQLSKQQQEEKDRLKSLDTQISQKPKSPPQLKKIEQKNNMDNIDLSMNISKMSDEMVKPFCEKLRDLLQKSLGREKELKQQLEQFQNIQGEIDVLTLTKERDEYKQLYLNECKKNNLSRVVLESQKRLINKQLVNDIQGNSVNRPFTSAQKNRYIIK